MSDLFWLGFFFAAGATACMAAFNLGFRLGQITPKDEP